jgi:hypothetical protein
MLMVALLKKKLVPWHQEGDVLKSR